MCATLLSFCFCACGHSHAAFVCMRAPRSLIQSCNCLQMLCRLADEVDLPTQAQLEAFYGGRAHLPPHPWGDYYTKVACGRAPYSRHVDWLTHSEADFRKRLAPDEVGRVTRDQVCTERVWHVATT